MSRLNLRRKGLSAMDKLVLEARIQSFGDSSAGMATFTLRQLLQIMLENDPNTKEAVVSLEAMETDSPLGMSDEPEKLKASRKSHIAYDELKHLEDQLNGYESISSYDSDNEGLLNRYDFSDEDLINSEQVATCDENESETVDYNLELHPQPQDMLDEDAVVGEEICLMDKVDDQQKLDLNPVLAPTVIVFTPKQQFNLGLVRPRTRFDKTSDSSSDNVTTCVERKDFQGNIVYDFDVIKSTRSTMAGCVSSAPSNLDQLSKLSVPALNTTEAKPKPRRGPPRIEPYPPAEGSSGCHEFLRVSPEMRAGAKRLKR